MAGINEALKQFDATEANLQKLERLWSEIEGLIPEGTVFANGDEYENKVREFRGVLRVMPAIDGYTIPDQIYGYEDMALMLVEANEGGTFEGQVMMTEEITQQGKSLREYRFRFMGSRRELVRSACEDIVGKIDVLMPVLQSQLVDDAPSESVESDEFESLKTHVRQLDTLFGSMKRPSRWSDLQRHLYFGVMQDLSDILRMDWPEIKQGLEHVLYSENDPLPVDVPDLHDLTETQPSGDILEKLKWETLSDDDFERLVFALISDASGYRNPQWLTNTNAPDRGRDLSVERVTEDSLGESQVRRVIIQCKHWLSKSVGPSDIGSMRDKMKLWEPPRVDVLVVATTGRFTSDAVLFVERHNQGDTALRIEMWAESHFERVLAKRPGIVAQFHLRG